MGNWFDKYEMPELLAAQEPLTLVLIGTTIFMDPLGRPLFGKRVTILKRRKKVIERAFAAVDVDWLVALMQARFSGCDDNLTPGDLGIRRTVRKPLRRRQF